MQLLTTNGVGRGMELGDKLVARTEACTEGGAVYAAASTLERVYASNCSPASPFLTGALTMADVAVFCYLGHATCGFFDGIPPSFIKAFTHLTAVRKAVVGLPVVKKYYESTAGEEYMKLSMGGIEVGGMYAAMIDSAK